VSSQSYQPLFRCNSVFKCALQPEIAKKTLKPPILEGQGHRCWQF